MQLAECDVGVNANHLLAHPLLQGLLQAGETEPGYGNRAKLRKRDGAITTNGQCITGALFAKQLHVDDVAGANGKIGRHRNIGSGRKRGGGTGKQVVAKGLQALRCLRRLIGRTVAPGIDRHLRLPGIRARQYILRLAQRLPGVADTGRLPECSDIHAILLGQTLLLRRRQLPEHVDLLLRNATRQLRSLCHRSSQCQSTSKKITNHCHCSIH
nr:hypothetical protein [Permianibacter fluminis]